MATIIYANYNYCCTISFHVLNVMNGYYDFFSTGLISTLKVFILCKKYEAEDGQGLGAMNSDIP